MIEIIEFDGEIYPKFQAEGNASQFAIPYAKLLCKGVGYDIGYGEEEWKLPGAIGIDPKHNPSYGAAILPEGKVDYIYSSHCLEHLTDWVFIIEYWVLCLNQGGVMFLYLPHADQKYWLPWNNRKHKHILYAHEVKECMERFGMTNIFYSERDLNHSFMIVGEKW